MSKTVTELRLHNENVALRAEASKLREEVARLEHNIGCYKEIIKFDLEYLEAVKPHLVYKERCRISDYVAMGRDKVLK